MDKCEYRDLAEKYMSKLDTTLTDMYVWFYDMKCEGFTIEEIEEGILNYLENEELQQNGTSTFKGGNR